MVYNQFIGGLLFILHQKQSPNRIIHTASQNQQRQTSVVLQFPGYLYNKITRIISSLNKPNKSATLVYFYISLEVTRRHLQASNGVIELTVKVMKTRRRRVAAPDIRPSPPLFFNSPLFADTGVLAANKFSLFAFYVERDFVW